MDAPKCQTCNTSLDLMDEKQVFKAVGSNFDIVTYEQQWDCSVCGNQTTSQESIRECVTTTDSMTDELSLPTTPARFDT